MYRHDSPARKCSVTVGFCTATSGPGATNLIIGLADDEWPAFAISAASYAITAERIHAKNQVAAAIERMLSTPGPYFLHVELSEQSKVDPLCGRSVAVNG